MCRDLVHDNYPAILKKIAFIAQLAKCLRIRLPDHDIGPCRSRGAEPFDDRRIVGDPEIVGRSVDVLGISCDSLFHGIRSCDNISHINFLPLVIDDFGKKRRPQAQPSSIDYQAGCHASFELSR